MQKVWTIREELFNIFHRWPMILASFAIGCLVGWVISYLWPPAYRTSADIYVGINPYRTYSDVEFLALTSPKYSNIDDYKNWQMVQLETVIFTDDFIETSLSALRQEDPYWNNIRAEELLKMLSADWRSAGKWSLIAEHRDPIRATQAAEAWSQVSIERVKEAVVASQNAFMIDQKLQILATEEVQSRLRSQILSDTQPEMDSWLRESQNHPSDQPLEPADRWQVLSLAAKVAQFDPAWMNLMENQPSANAPRRAYENWMAQIISLVEAEIPILEKRSQIAEDQREELADQYATQAEISLSLSPNLTFEGLEIMDAEPIRATSSLMIIGGLIGLSVWLLIQLARITREH